MKRGLSGWEKGLVVVPLAAAAIAWVWPPVLRAFCHHFPQTHLSVTSPVLLRTHFSPDGSLLARSEIAGDSLDSGPGSIIRYTIQVWETASGLRLWRMTLASAGGQRGFSDVDFSPDGTTIVVVDTQFNPDSATARISSSTVRLLDARSGRPVREFSLQGVARARFVDGGKKIFCDGIPSRIIDSRTGTVLAETDARPSIRDREQLSNDGKTGLLSRETKAAGATQDLFERWNFAVPRLEKSFIVNRHGNPAGFRQYQLSADGQLAYTWLRSGPSMEVWNTLTGKPSKTVPHIQSPGINVMSIDPTGQFLLLLKRRYFGRYEAVFYDKLSSRVVWTRPGHVAADGGGLFDSAQFSADSRFVITSGDGELIWWDVKTGRSAHRDAGNRVVFSPDGRSMVVARERGLELLPAPVIP